MARPTVRYGLSRPALPGEVLIELPRHAGHARALGSITSDTGGAVITNILAYNYRCLKRFELSCNPKLNILVGDNEAGKSTVLEAVNLALTKRLNGRYLEQELTPHLFHKDVVAAYMGKVKAGEPAPLPRLRIEVFFEDRKEFANLRGSNNSKKIDAPGVYLELAFNDGFAAEYDTLLKKPGGISSLPTEYYKVEWANFAGNQITARAIPVSASYIDATTIRLQSGSDYYLQSIISAGLTDQQRLALAIAYRGLREQFALDPSLRLLNPPGRTGILSPAPLTFGMETTTRTSWETNLVPHLGTVPFSFIGKGEQSALKTVLALDQKAQDASVVLLEEPENHLSYSSMARLIAAIAAKCGDKQLFITTHSAYVLNRLGLDQVLLMSQSGAMSLTSLPAGTRDYFRKLPGYDTLRLILAKRAVLVEGPSDEILFQKAYKVHTGRWPSDDGVDIISVRGLSFARFLAISKALGIATAVITDNDSDYAKNVVARYSAYTAGTSTIRVYSSTDNSLSTIELCLLAKNGRSKLGQALGRAFDSDATARGYLLANKTDVALALLDTTSDVDFPEHMVQAISDLVS